MSAEHGGPVIVFDGVCVLCNGWVRFLLRHDREGVFRFAAMQTEAGRTLLEGYGLNPADPASFLLVDAAGAWTDTDAIARVLGRLGGPWSLPAAVLRWLPRRARDAAYRLLARNRYRWFGRREACALPPPSARDRFIGQG